MRRTGIMLVAALLAAPATARPVTYPGGAMSMTQVDGTSIITQVDYTINRRFAAGVYTLSELGGDRLAAGVVGNFLLARKNTAQSQTNAYLYGGIGPSWQRNASGGRRLRTGGYAAVEADWETRRYFLGAMGTVSGTTDGSFGGFRLRAGVAPYVGDSGDLHTWLFGQVWQAAEAGSRVEVGPVIRLFKGGVLAEAGVSARGRGFGTLWFYF